MKLISEQDPQCDSHTGKFLITRLSSSTKIIAHQRIQDLLTVSHEQREKRMFDGKLNAQRENCIFQTLYRLFHSLNTVFTSTIGSRSFQSLVTALKVHLFTCVFQPHRGLLPVDTVTSPSDSLKVTLASSNAQDSKYTRRGCLEIPLDFTWISFRLSYSA